jgi:predicted DNA-binding protein
MANNNKDYILNIRVPKETYEKVKGMARENSESVSALIRKVIKDSEEIIGDIFSPKDHWGDIKTYSTSKAARDIECEKSGKKIKKGSTVIVGETSSGRRHYFAPGYEPK